MQLEILKNKKIKILYIKNKSNFRINLIDYLNYSIDFYKNYSIDKKSTKNTLYINFNDNLQIRKFIKLYNLFNS